VQMAPHSLPCLVATQAGQEAEVDEALEHGKQVQWCVARFPGRRPDMNLDPRYISRNLGVVSGGWN
jgi:hypothetical protein